MLKVGKIGDPNQKVNPWLIILLTAPIAIAVLGYLVYRWTVVRTDYSRMANQMIQRQNAVLAHDAMAVAKDVAKLLENAARDVQLLAVIHPTSSNLLKFYLSRLSQVTQLHTKDDSVDTVPLPVYNEIIYYNLQGDEVVRFRNGRSESNLKRFSQCTESTFCDRKLMERAMGSPVGELVFGSLMRWYSSEGSIEVEEGAFVPVIYRHTDSLILLGIDYRYFKEFLTQPTFPYDRKRNLLQSYQNGNYVYIVDSDFNFLIHPKYWHVTGVDRTTGQRAVPIKEDSEDGKRPLNIVAYQGKKLQEYFKRLRTRSFLQKSVDIFEAPNLKGTNRVLSVAPILLSRGQFRQSGVYGYVVLGCSVDYFEEPREQYVPYY